MSVDNDLTLVDGLHHISYVTESDMQAALVKMAKSFGWITESELVVPGWGRLDLVLHAAEYRDFAHVFEFKLELTKLSGIRKAFQQADGYARWLQSQGIERRVILAASEIDHAACNDAACAYRDSVTLMKIPTVMGLISSRSHWKLRINRVRALHAELVKQQRLVMHAHNQLVFFEREHRRAQRKAQPIPPELLLPSELATP